MIWSVSILTRRSGAAMPECVTNGSMTPSSAGNAPRIGDATGDRRGGDSRRAREMRPRPRPLPALEIAVGRADDAAIRQPVVPHMGAEAAARLVPLEAGRLEDAVEPFRLGGGLHRSRAGNAD